MPSSSGTDQTYCSKTHSARLLEVRPVLIQNWFWKVWILTVGQSQQDNTIQEHAQMHAAKFQTTILASQICEAIVTNHDPSVPNLRGHCNILYCISQNTYLKWQTVNTMCAFFLPTPGSLVPVCDCYWLLSLLFHRAQELKAQTFNSPPFIVEHGFSWEWQA
jgi:hypothetical protein